MSESSQLAIVGYRRSRRIQTYRNLTWISTLNNATSRAAILLLGTIHAVLLCSSNSIRDDAFIYFRYVEHLVDGHGLTWNIGEPPVEGYTSFLYLIFLSIPTFFGFDILPMSQLTNITIYLGTIYLLARFSADYSRKIGQHSLSANWLLPLLFASSARLAVATRSGLETTLFCFMIVLFLYRCICPQLRYRDFAFLGFVAGLLCLSRPEGLIVVLLVGLVSYLASDDSLRVLSKKSLVCWGTFGVIGVSYLSFRWFYFGDILPNTYYAKVGTSFIAPSVGISHLAAFAISIRGMLVLTSLVIGCFVRSVPLLRVVNFCLVFWLVYLAFFLGVDDFEGWHAVPTDLFAILGIGLGAMHVMTRSPRLLHVGTAIFTFCSIWPNVKMTINRGHISTELFEPSILSHVGGFVEIGQVLRTYLPSQSVVAVGAVGAISYFSKLTIIDTLGLNDRHVARTSTDPNQPVRLFGHEKGDGAYVLSREPDVLIVMPYLTEQPFRGYAEVEKSSREIFQNASFYKNYQFQTLKLSRGYFNFYLRSDLMDRNYFGSPVTL